MSLNMTREEREAFLADVHVGVLSIEQPEGPPLAAPVWYDYRPDRGLWFVTEAESRKGRALDAAMRCTLVAQSEEAPAYKYVSVSGPVVDVRPADEEAHRRPMAHRYLGREMGDLYVKSTGNEGNRVYTMRPERWLTLDYTKLSLA
jgi:nitroimidazol reductase NimA-like FMN-containing flavoprotein (pyridoxamine 5'-phosphate oxidase superfamily)